MINVIDESKIEKLGEFLCQYADSHPERTVLYMRSLESGKCEILYSGDQQLLERFLFSAAMDDVKLKEVICSVAVSVLISSPEIKSKFMDVLFSTDSKTIPPDGQTIH